MFEPYPDGVNGTNVNNVKNLVKRLPQFRVAVNSRCGRACFFCRPSGEGVSTAAGVELAVDELVAVAAEIKAQGIDSIKLTGGDPALYGPLEEGVLRLKDEVGFSDIEVISRHPRIGERASRLAAGGVTRFNMSLDTLDSRLHQELCGVNDHEAVVGAVRQCVATGVPVKVNMVVMNGVNDEEVEELVEFCGQSGVKTLKLLDVIKDLDSGAESFATRLATKRGRQLPDLYRGMDDIIEKFAARSARRNLQTQGGLGHPMTSLIMDSGLEVLVKDSTAGAWYGSMCKSCRFFPCHDALMALRLTADLRLQFCLLRDDYTVKLDEVVKWPQALATTIREALELYAGATFHSANSNESAKTRAEITV